MRKKKIVVLGSTGSIGESALQVARQYKDRIDVVGLSVNANIGRLQEQVAEFGPSCVAVGEPAKAAQLARRLPRGVKVFAGRDGICRLAAESAADVIVLAIVGSEALFPLLAALSAGKTVALANKESIVVAGPLVRRELRAGRGRLVPVDSEQSAIFQCLEGRDPSTVQTLYLTASGGPLWRRRGRRLKEVSVREVLAHPRWKMGRKITVDSATLMNKGLEVLEARQLFDVPLEKIRVVVHPEALIHSMVEFVDGSLLAQMAVTDMKLPIQYALSYPERWPNARLRLDPSRIGTLTFAAPDLKRFPCLALAFAAGRRGGLAPCVLNAANEVAVAAFLEKRLPFRHIPSVIERALSRVETAGARMSLETVFAADAEAREAALREVARVK
jgi:1-deoxy-D-xylulose-5-phosphate reductoisomerase